MNPHEYRFCYSGLWLLKSKARMLGALLNKNTIELYTCLHIFLHKQNRQTLTVLSFNCNVGAIKMMSYQKNVKNPIQYFEDDADIETLEIDVSHLVTSVTHLSVENGEIISSETVYFPDSANSFVDTFDDDFTPFAASSLNHGLEAVKHFSDEDLVGHQSLNEGMQAVDELMNESVCESTKKQYQYAFRRWISFCQENSLVLLPADVQHVSACVAFVAKETCSVSAAETLSASISYEHRKAFLPTPTQHPSHLLLMKSIRRKYSRERTPAAPVSKKLLHKMVDFLFKDSHGVDAIRAPLTLWRTVWRLIIQFHTLSRFADLIDLKVSALKFLAKPEKTFVNQIWQIEE